MPHRQRPSIILVVDDDRGLTRLIERVLQREGCTTAAAHSGAEALAWLARQSADLMLLDLKLPDIEGRSLIQKLADAGHSTPFIIITGQGDERVAVDMMKRGAMDYLVKDVQFVEFIPEVVRRVLDQLQKERRLAFAERQAHLAQTVIEQSYSAVMITSADSADPTIFYVNPTFTNLGRFSADELVGRRISEIPAFEDRWNPLRRVLAAQSPFVGEMVMQSPDRGLQHVECTVAPVLDPAQKPSHWAVLLRDITERKRLEKEILEISERERQRIGRDLHDGLGQQLTALEMYNHSVTEEARRQAPKLVPPLTEIGLQLRDAISQARALSHGLSPVALEADGLMNAFRKLTQMTSTLAKVDCRFVCPQPVLLTDPAAAVHLYRIAQEAVQNALKHGRAKKIEVHLAEHDGGWVMRIQDNGRGLPRSESRTGGSGLRIMRYRAELIGATLELSSAPRKGVRVTCTLPPKP